MTVYRYLGTGTGTGTGTGNGTGAGLAPRVDHVVQVSFCHDNHLLSLTANTSS